jgi:hypothetical protein
MPHFIFIQQISVLNILNMLYNLHFFSSKCRLFHNATLFGFCITHILNTGCAKIWKKKSVARSLIECEIARKLHLVWSKHEVWNKHRFQHLNHLSLTQKKVLKISKSLALLSAVNSIWKAWTLPRHSTQKRRHQAKWQVQKNRGTLK